MYPDHENLDSRETKRANYTVEDERGAGKQTIDSPCRHTYDARQDGGRCEPSIWEISDKVTLVLTQEKENQHAEVCDRA